MNTEGFKITIIWCYEDKDCDDMEETGKELSEMVKIPFVFKPYKM